MFRSERYYGSFRRVIPLPEDARVDQAQARFENGVLEVSVPISESSTWRRQIPITTAAGTVSGSNTAREKEGTRKRG